MRQNAQNFLLFVGLATVAGLMFHFGEKWFFPPKPKPPARSEEHTSELQSQSNLVCRLLLEKQKLQKSMGLGTRRVSSLRTSFDPTCLISSKRWISRRLTASTLGS